METIWVLESCYELDKQSLILTFEKILRISQFHIEHSEAMWAALHEFQDLNIDLSDCLIGTIAQTMHCDGVLTFDKKATQSKFFKLIQ